ncbi:hypothetical protein ABZY57_04255 [Streptomyces sp. NPDC006450]|uniref:hypothetical protein n=1 Tax=Streptomyces sp. NPDC006450 TaxID=3155458 RepID=UPI0033BBB4AA
MPEVYPDQFNAHVGPKSGKISNFRAPNSSAKVFRELRQCVTRETSRYSLRVQEGGSVMARGGDAPPKDATEKATQDALDSIDPTRPARMDFSSGHSGGTPDSGTHLPDMSSPGSGSSDGAAELTAGLDLSYREPSDTTGDHSEGVHLQGAEARPELPGRSQENADPIQGSSLNRPETGWGGELLRTPDTHQGELPSNLLEPESLALSYSSQTLSSITKSLRI